MRWMILGVAVIALPGCGIIADIQQREQFEQIKSAMEGETSYCRRQFSLPPITNLRLQIECINNAENAHVRPVFPYPDLLTLRQTTRIAIAARVERKEISPEDAAVELARVDTAAHSELNRRETAATSAAAQASAARAANRGVACTRIGNNVLCN